MRDAMNLVFFPGLLLVVALYGAAIVVGGFLLGFAFRKGWDAAAPRPPSRPA
jgi:hypothetical protein